MGKLKDLAMSICEEYERGWSIDRIAKKHDLTKKEVCRILVDFYGDLVRER